MAAFALAALCFADLRAFIGLSVLLGRECHLISESKRNVKPFRACYRSRHQVVHGLMSASTLRGRRRLQGRPAEWRGDTLRYPTRKPKMVEASFSLQTGTFSSLLFVVLGV